MVTQMLKLFQRFADTFFPAPTPVLSALEIKRLLAAKYPTVESMVNAVVTHIMPWSGGEFTEIDSGVNAVIWQDRNGKQMAWDLFSSHDDRLAVISEKSETHDGWIETHSTRNKTGVLLGFTRNDAGELIVPNGGAK